MNFAEGAFAVAAAFVLIRLETDGVPVVLGIALVVVGGALLGFVVEVGVMRRLRSASALTKTIATLGVLIIIQATCQLIFGSLPEVLPQFLPEDSVVIGPARCPWRASSYSLCRWH